MYRGSAYLNVTGNGKQLYSCFFSFFFFHFFLNVYSLKSKSSKETVIEKAFFPLSLLHVNDLSSLKIKRKRKWKKICSHTKSLHWLLLNIWRTSNLYRHLLLHIYKTHIVTKHLLILENFQYTHNNYNQPKADLYSPVTAHAYTKHTYGSGNIPEENKKSQWVRELVTRF
jgi:hypothetical protein